MIIFLAFSFLQYFEHVLNTTSLGQFFFFFFFFYVHLDKIKQLIWQSVYLTGSYLIPVCLKETSFPL